LKTAVTSKITIYYTLILFSEIKFGYQDALINERFYSWIDARQDESELYIDLLFATKVAESDKANSPHKIK
jgi:hypothetical protein